MSGLDSELGQPLYLGIDFGYRNPFACLWLQPMERGERVLVLDEYYQRLRTTAENGRAILTHTISMGYTPIAAAYADPANPEGHTILSAILGIEVQAPRRPVARALGVHRGTIYRWFHEGMLGGVKFAKTIRISPDSVERLLAASRSDDSLAGE